MIAFKLSSGDIIPPMTAKKSFVDGAMEAVRARLVTVIVWVVIIAVIYVSIQVNRYRHAVTVAHLSSANAAVRDAEILEWSRSEQLADALASTEDPNSDDKSPVNVKSKAIRETCSADYVALIEAGKAPDDEAMDNLYALHKDTDLPVQKASVAGLAFIGLKKPSNVTKMVARLADGDPDVRLAASDALGKIGGADVIAKLVGAINGNPPGAKDDALATLPKVGIPAAPAVVGLLNTPDNDFKGKLIMTLGTIADPRSIPTLEAEAQAQPLNPQIRRLSLLSLSAAVIANTPTPAALAAKQAAAAKAIAAKTPPPFVPGPADVKMADTASTVLIAAVNNPADDSRARSQCALALGHIKSAPAVTALITALSDIDSQISQAARTGLESAGPAAVPQLAVAVKSPAVQVRAGAAYALGGIGNPAALSALAPALSDPAIDVRRSACVALGYSSSKDAIPLLVARLSDDNGFVAGAASTSLVDIGAPAVPALVQALGSSNATAPLYASQALQAIGDAASRPVMQAAETGSDKQKTWCAVVLGWLHVPAAQPLLQRLAASSNPSTRFAATQALQQYTAG